MEIKSHFTALSSGIRNKTFTELSPHKAMTETDILMEEKMSLGDMQREGDNG